MRLGKPYFYALASTLIWSTVSSAFKITLMYMDYIQLLFYSTTVSTIVLSIIVIFEGKAGQLRSYGKGQFASSLLLGLLNPFLYYTVLFKAYSLLPAQQALTLNFIWPVLTVLMSALILKQKLTVGALLSMLLCFTGVVIISTRGDIRSLMFTDTAGVALALGSAFLFSAYWVYNVRDERDDTVKLMLNFLFSMPMVTAIYLFSAETWTVDYRGLIGTVYIGLFEMGVTFVLWLRALSLFETTAQAGSLVYLSRFLSLLLIRATVKERIHPSTIVGLILIIAGIYTLHRKPRGIPSPKQG